MASMDRHLTVSGFAVHEGRVALHWHRKIGAWLPAGGHIEPGEDPAEAVLREVHEEFNIDATIIETGPRTEYTGGPRQLPPPYTILNCEVAPGHEHVDLVYFLRVTDGHPGRSYDGDNPIEWLDAAGIEANAALAPDVRALALAAIRYAGVAAVGARPA
jgi:8-oxo-dGTP pyrophosphatase MutT (NUDIX family)